MRKDFKGAEIITDVTAATKRNWLYIYPTRPGAVDFIITDNKGNKAWLKSDRPLPENVATIDLNGLIGNVYTKGEIDTLLEELGIEDIIDDLDKKLDKPTKNNTSEYVLLADGSTFNKDEFGKVAKVNNKEPDEDKNITLKAEDIDDNNGESIEERLGDVYTKDEVNTKVEHGDTAFGWGDHSKAGYLTQHQDISGKADKSEVYTRTQTDNILGNYYTKVEDPEDGKTYLLDVNGNAVDADSFGRNIANADLTTDATRKFTQGFSYEHATEGKPYFLTGLPDKSTDTSFSLLRVQDESGQEAIVKNLYNVLYNGLSDLTSTQSLNIAQLLNGGVGSAGNMSVNLISPPIVQKIDSDEYIMLRGANLNLNAVAMQIEILNSVTENVVATIPNSQIQIYAEGTSLTFYYNFKDLPFGTYKIRLTSGVKVYTTTLELRVVNEVENINLDTITWDILYDDDITPNSNDFAIGRNINLETPSGSEMIGATPKVAIKSSEIFAQDEDFNLEIKIIIGLKSEPQRSDYNRTYFGVGYSNLENELTPLSLISASFDWTYNSSVRFFNTDKMVLNAITPLNVTVNFIKTGNLFRVIVDNTNESIILSNNGGYSLFFSIVGRRVPQNLQIQLIKGYIFN